MKWKIKNIRDYIKIKTDIRTGFREWQKLSSKATEFPIVSSTLEEPPRIFTL